MRRIINSTYVTLDGVIQNPQDWPSLGSFGDEGGQIQNTLLAQCDAVLMGRRTYEGFAPVWSARSGDPMSDRMNALPKYVVSTTLTDPAWHNTTVVHTDPIEAIRELTQRPGADIVQYGFGPLSHALMAAGLLDELRLWMHPFFVGKGDQLYQAGSTGSFTLADTQILDSGIVILTYRNPEN
ncbi:MAG TPA: dihydrofolate reductase family protein [Pseudonocardiaceae bacterium]|jgi:dihydrofolate reductase